MEICPGHPLDPGMLDRARREFALMNIMEKMITMPK